jgi:hypothetical protein
MDAIDLIVAGMAVLGGVLGVINTLWALTRDRVRLKVKAEPREEYSPDWHRPVLLVTIVNLSYFDVAVERVVLVPKRRKNVGQYIDIRGPQPPYSLKSRAALTLTFGASADDRERGFPVRGYAIVQTSCGVRRMARYSLPEDDDGTDGE